MRFCLAHRLFTALAGTVWIIVSEHIAVTTTSASESSNAKAFRGRSNAWAWEHGGYFQSGGGGNKCRIQCVTPAACIHGGRDGKMVAPSLKIEASGHRERAARVRGSQRERDKKGRIKRVMDAMKRR